MRTTSMHLFILLAAACLFSCTTIAQTQNQSSDNKAAAKPPPWPLQLEVRVPFEPTAFPSGPHVYLMYELHLTNFMPMPVSLSRIDVLDSDAGTSKPIATFEPAHDGASLQQLTSGSANDGDPNWSPDGNRIVFGGEPALEGRGQQSSKALQIMNLTSGQVSTVPGSENLWSPRWSPNGRYIAAQSADSTMLLLYDFETQKWRNLVQLNAEYFSWSHDGKYIYLTTSATDSVFARIGVPDDHGIETLASLKDVHLFNGTFGTWTGIAPDDSLLVLRDTSADELYSLDVQAP